MLCSLTQGATDFVVRAQQRCPQRICSFSLCPDFILLQEGDTYEFELKLL